MEGPHEGTTYGDWRDQLFNDGYIVLKAVITPERAQSYVDRMMAWLESFPYGFCRDRKSTWNTEHLPVSLKFVAASPDFERFIYGCAVKAVMSL